MGAVTSGPLSIAVTTALALYWVVLALLSVYGAHRIALVVRYLHLRGRRQGSPRVGPKAPLPTVTVQLPLYNEANVAARLIEAVGRMRYPPDLLDIQVLDDSTDETCAIVDQCAKRLRAAGVSIEVIRRKQRDGFKAGALAVGLTQARGEILLVLDADFVPCPDLLERAVVHFEDAHVGMVQARWGHLNEGSSRLTRAQALMLDGHFVIEHGARALSGCFFNFNGTAGLWRREAIVSSGGWQADTLTEDLDLSYRAQLTGWRFVYLPEIIVPAEVPELMTAFKSQQHRWAQGGVETARKLLGKIMRAQLPWRVKLEALFHLSANITYVLILLLGLLLPVTLWRGEGSAAAALTGLLVFAFGTAGLAVFYLASRARWQVAKDIPSLLALGIGISISQTFAALAGLRRQSTEFVRTPKRGDDRSVKKYWSARSRIHWLEIGMALYAASTATVAFGVGALAALPLPILFAAGFGWVGIASAFEQVASRPSPPVDAAGAAGAFR